MDGSKGVAMKTNHPGLIIAALLCLSGCLQTDGAITSTEEWRDDNGDVLRHELTWHGGQLVEKRKWRNGVLIEKCSESLGYELECEEFPYADHGLRELSN